MNILVVDDDLIEIRVISSIIDKERLGVREIFTASRVSEAREMLLSNSIDIVICDIEMPRENGLELLEWMKEKKHRASAIVLTSHADFGYASRAIKSGTENYLLKPVEDEELNNALDDVIKKQKEKKKQRLAEKNWDYHLQEIRETYFREVACGSLTGSREELLGAAQIRGITLQADGKYIPVLFCAKNWGSAFGDYSRNMQQFILKNIAGEILENHKINGFCCGVHERGIMAVIFSEKKDQKEQLRKVCQEFLDTFLQLYGCKMCAYVGEEVALEELGTQAQILNRRELNNVVFKGTVIFSDMQCLSCDVPAFDYEKFGELLAVNGAKEALKMIRDTVQSGVRKKAIDGELLIKFQKNILQESNVLLKKAGLKADLLFKENRYRELEKISCLSVENFEEWAMYLTDKIEKLFQGRKSSTAVEVAEEYIRNNLESIESCQDIAQAVYLDADYLSRLFRKRKGISLQKYLNQARMEQAKNLLTFTELSVSEIAIQTGYKNFSHFSTAFKREEKISPVEYRKKILGSVR